MKILTIYCVYHYYDTANTIHRYYMDIWGIPGKIEINKKQYDSIRVDAKRNGFCRHTHISNPTNIPFSYPENTRMYVHIYVVS